MAPQVTQPGWVTIARLHPIAWWSQACNIFWFEIADGGSVAPAECQVLKLKRPVSEEDTDCSSEGKGSALHLALPQFTLPLSHLSPEWGASGATATHCCITLSSNRCQSVLDSLTSPLLPISLLPIWACCLCLQHQLPEGQQEKVVWLEYTPVCGTPLTVPPNVIFPWMSGTIWKPRRRDGLGPPSGAGKPSRCVESPCSQGTPRRLQSLKFCHCCIFCQCKLYGKERDALGQRRAFPVPCVVLNTTRN